MQLHRITSLKKKMLAMFANLVSHKKQQSDIMLKIRQEGKYPEKNSPEA